MTPSSLGIMGVSLAGLPLGESPSQGVVRSEQPRRLVITDKDFRKYAAMLCKFVNVEERCSTWYNLVNGVSNIIKHS